MWKTTQRYREADSLNEGIGEDGGRVGSMP